MCDATHVSCSPCSTLLLHVIYSEMKRLSSDVQSIQMVTLLESRDCCWCHEKWLFFSHNIFHCKKFRGEEKKARSSSGSTNARVYLDRYHSGWDINTCALITLHKISILYCRCWERTQRFVGVHFRALCDPWEHGNWAAHVRSFNWTYLLISER